MKKPLSLLFRLWIPAIFSIVISCAPIRMNAQDLDHPPRDSEVNYAPADGEVSATNPAAFVWLPVDGVDKYIMQYSRSRTFSPDSTFTIKDLDITVHVPYEVMKPGIWFWHYGFREEGKERFSRIRSFRIPETATIFPLIPVNMFISHIPESRPWLHFTPELVEEIRSDTEGRFLHITKPVIESAEEILSMKEPLFEEPRPWEEYDNPGSVYVDTWIAIRPYTQRMVICALAYFYTGEEKFAAEARRRLMHFMDWDLKGASTCIRRRELTMDIAENAPPVFDSS